MANDPSFVRRKRKESDFTQLSNKMLRDARLSWKARGLLAYMLSMPDDWVFYESELINHSEKDGITSLRSAMKELKNAGYVSKVALKDENGKIKRWVTYVEEEPNQITGNLQCGKSTIWENHHVENQTLPISINTNTDITNTDNTNTITAPASSSVIEYINSKLYENPNKMQQSRLNELLGLIREPEIATECIDITAEKCPDKPMNYLLYLLEKAVTNNFTLDDVKRDYENHKRYGGSL